VLIMKTGKAVSW